MSDRPRDDGYDDFLDGLEATGGFYLADEDGNGYLPPREVGPKTGGELTTEPLPESGVIETYSRTEVPPPSLADDAPYIIAVADFGPVSLTGQFRAEDDTDIEVGMPVEATVGRTVTEDERIVVLRPR
jgi:uncharacterized OB-fold protein